jgi:hypothetical protein
MEWHLRLADRRGLLQGRSLSSVAVVAIELLYLMDMQDKAKDFWNKFRISLVAGGQNEPDDIKRLFPELFTQKQEITEDTDIDDIDLGQLEWSAPTTDFAKEQFLELQKQIDQNQHGLLKPANNLDMNDGGWV